MRTMSLGRRSFLALAACALATVATSRAHADRYSDAVAHEGRPAGDLKRDVIDHPAEILRLAGIRPGMTVVDFLAADGYYSELASYIVGPRGHVYLLNNVAYDKWSNDDWQGRVDGSRLTNVEHHTIVLEHLGLPAHSVDAVLLIKVYHDLFWKPGNGPWPKDIDPDAVLTEIARIMKPGGVLLLVDASHR
jgi:predicted methyltransferase